MKVYYILFIMPGSSGVRQKVKSQIIELIKNGIDVSIVLGCEERDNNFIKQNANNIFDDIPLKIIKISTFNRFKSVNKILYMWQFYNALGKLVKNTSPDFLYFRGIPADPNLFFFSMRFNGKIIFEVNTIIQNEYRIRKAYFKLILSKIFMKKILLNAAACVTITDEIACSLKKLTGKSLKTKTISNGINIESFPLHSPTKRKDNELRLIFVGHIAEWHGLDRLLKGIANYNGDYSVNLLIVGDGNLLESYKQFVAKNKIEDKVEFCGVLSGTELDNVFNKSDIAISTLALHRKGMIETAALKNREYLARGIPFILSDIDVDLKGKNEIKLFILRVLSNDEPIKIEAIIEFYKRFYLIPDYKLKIRNFAEVNIDIKTKIKNLYNLLSNGF